MGLLNFVDTGFIIILAILLLISGGIMFYCYRRLNILEDSIINQGKILQNLIINIQNNNLVSDTLENDTLENDTLENDTLENNTLENDIFENDILENNNSKVEVSDDDSDDEENIKSIKLKNSYLEYENSSEENNSEEDNSDKESLNIDDEEIDDDEITNQDLGLINNKILENSLINISMKMANPKDDDVKILELSNDVLSEIKDEAFMSNINTEKIDEQNTQEKKDNKIKGLNKMKLDELKQLVINKEINLEEDINSMKKADLIKVLSN